MAIYLYKCWIIALRIPLHRMMIINLHADLHNVITLNQVSSNFLKYIYIYLWTSVNKQVYSYLPSGLITSVVTINFEAEVHCQKFKLAH